MRIKIAKLYISPVVFHGYVEIKKESLLEMEKHELVIFFLSGAVGNVFLIGVSLLLVSNFINFYFSIVNICYATASVLPFIIGNNDMTTMIKVLKELIKSSLKKKATISSFSEVVVACYFYLLSSTIAY